MPSLTFDPGSGPVDQVERSERVQKNGLCNSFPIALCLSADKALEAFLLSRVAQPSHSLCCTHDLPRRRSAFSLADSNNNPPGVTIPRETRIPPMAPDVFPLSCPRHPQPPREPTITGPQDTAGGGHRTLPGGDTWGLPELSASGRSRPGPVDPLLRSPLTGETTETEDLKDNDLQPPGDRPWLSVAFTGKLLLP
ncbi:unnamed protein product [Lota lota]